MAGLSKFIVADLSGPSVPEELRAILAELRKPVLAFGDPCSLLPGTADRTGVITVEGDDSDLLRGLEENLSRLESMHVGRVVRLAQMYAEEEEARLSVE